MLLDVNFFIFVGISSYHHDTALVWPRQRSVMNRGGNKRRSLRRANLFAQHPVPRVLRLLRVLLTCGTACSTSVCCVAVGVGLWPQGWWRRKLQPLFAPRSVCPLLATRDAPHYLPPAQGLLCASAVTAPCLTMKSTTGLGWTALRVFSSRTTSRSEATE